MGQCKSLQAVSRINVGEVSYSARACSHKWIAKAFNDQGEMDKSQEHYVEFLESREDATKAFESAKQSFDFVTPSVHGAIVIPRSDSILLWRNDRNKAKVKCQLSCVVAFVRTIHQQVNRPRCRPQPVQQATSFGRIVGIARRQRECKGRSGICGNQVNLSCPAAPRFAYGLRAVFFNAPVPSGCTLTEVLSSDTASILMRTT